MCFPKKANGSLFQTVATRIGDLLCLNYGLLFGITSSQILLYQSDGTPLTNRINAEGASLLGTYLCLGGIIGALIGGFAAKRIGPKSVLMLCGLLQMACWFWILFSYNITHIYSSRVVGGLAAGGTFTVLPMYIREISEEQNRLSLELTIDPMKSLGVFVGFLLASLAPYDYIPVIGVVQAFAFTMCFPFMPESPYYFVRKGDVPMMEKSLRWFRGIRQLDDRNKPEFLEEVSKFVELQKGHTKFDEVISPGYKVRLFIISVVLVVASQLCGIFMILNYAESLFEFVGTPVPAHWSAITLAGGLWFGSALGSLLSSRVNHKIILSVTSLLSGVALFTLSVLMGYGNILCLDESQRNWLPLSFLLVYVFIASIGFYPLGGVVIGELAPAKIKGAVTTLSMSCMWLLALLTVKFYYLLMDSIGFTGLLWIFGSFCVLEFVFVICCVPETRGKSQSEISSRLGGWSSAVAN